METETTYATDPPQPVQVNANVMIRNKALLTVTDGLLFGFGFGVSITVVLPLFLAMLACLIVIIITMFGSMLPVLV